MVTDPWAPPEVRARSHFSPTVLPPGPQHARSSVHGSLQARTLEWVMQEM